MGKFLPDQSGNPGGRPRGYVEVRALARIYTKRAIRRLAHEVDNGDSSAARIAAASVLLDRGWGKPTVSVAAELSPSNAGIEGARNRLNAALDRIRERSMGGAEPCTDG
jgi:hypothetical protein